MMYGNLPRFNDGAVHFVTTKTYQNNPYFLDNACCDILIKELDFYRKRYEFKILGYVIMPDHLHLLIWWDVDGNKELTISKIIQGIKGHSAVRIRDYIETTGRLKPLLQSDESRGSHLSHKRGLKYRFYDFNILSRNKFIEKINYIHANPLKDKRIANPGDYPYSSRLFYETGEGVLSIDLL